MTRFCASCGTEVDETAIFCPTCGQPIDQDVEAAIPPAPAWPEPAAAAADRPVRDEAPTRPIEPEWGSPPEPPPADPAWEAAQTPPPPAAPPPVRREPPPIEPVSERHYEPEPEPAPRPDVPAPISPPPPADRPAPPPPRPAGASPLSTVPITTPVTLSGWLIGIGAILAAVGALIALFDGIRTVVDLIVLVAMAAVAVSIFFSSRLPAFGHLRLAVLAIVLVAFGAATDRILAGVGSAGELLVFLGAAAVVIGAILLETGRDQPLGGA